MHSTWYDVLPKFSKGLYFQQMVKNLDGTTSEANLDAAGAGAGGAVDLDDAHRVLTELLLPTTGTLGRVDPAVKGALWFLLSYEEHTVWPNWRRARSLSWRFDRTAERYMEKLLALSEAVGGPASGDGPACADAQMLVADAKSGPAAEEQLSETATIDGVLTSPPYPGVYDYVVDDGDCDRGLGAHVLLQRRGRRAEAEEFAQREIGSQQQRRDASLAKTDDAANPPAEGSAAEASVAAEAEVVGDVFAARWQADTVRWLHAVACRLKHPGGRIAMLIGDNAGIDALKSILLAARTVSVSALAAGWELRVVASASVSEDARRPWSTKKRNYRTEHTILLERVAAAGSTAGSSGGGCTMALSAEEPLL